MVGISAILSACSIITLSETKQLLTKYGRYDVVCPVRQAFDLQAALPGMKLEVIRNAGHASGEPGTVDALVKATDEMADIIRARHHV